MNHPLLQTRAATLCVHAGTYLDERTGGACSPLFPSTAYAFPNAANENFYPRYFNTPNQRVIERKVAALEKGEAALVFGSGMAAISSLLFARLKPGDHAIFQTDLYVSRSESRTWRICSRILTRLWLAVEKASPSRASESPL